MALENVNEIDYDYAMEVCEDEEELLITIAECFLDEWAIRIDHIEELYGAKSWEDYRTNVHALKGSALNLGCVGLSADAKAIELAVKEGNIEYAINHHEQLMQRLRKVLKELEDNLE